MLHFTPSEVIVINTRFKVQGALTAEDIGEAIATLTKLGIAVAQAETDKEPKIDSIEEKVWAIWNQMGDQTWELVVRCARNYDNERKFTLRNVAALFGRDVGTIKSWHRS